MYIFFMQSLIFLNIYVYTVIKTTTGGAYKSPAGLYTNYHTLKFIVLYAKIFVLFSISSSFLMLRNSPL